MHSNVMNSTLILAEQRKAEGSARIVPFLSFVLTHLALTAFLTAIFFMSTLDAKIVVVALGVLLIASEWIYTILISVRWRRDITARLLAEAESKQALESAERVTYEARIDMERQRWQREIQRRRWQRQERQQSS